MFPFFHLVTVSKKHSTDDVAIEKTLLSVVLKDSCKQRLWRLIWYQRKLVSKRAKEKETKLINMWFKPPASATASGSNMHANQIDLNVNGSFYERKYCRLKMAMHIIMVSSIQLFIVFSKFIRTNTCWWWGVQVHLKELWRYDHSSSLSLSFPSLHV